MHGKAKRSLVKFLVFGLIVFVVYMIFVSDDTKSFVTSETVEASVVLGTPKGRGSMEFSGSMGEASGDYYDYGVEKVRDRIELLEDRDKQLLSELFRSNEKVYSDFYVFANDKMSQKELELIKDLLALVEFDRAKIQIDHANGLFPSDEAFIEALEDQYEKGTEQVGEFLPHDVGDWFSRFRYSLFYRGKSKDLANRVRDAGIEIDPESFEVLTDSFTRAHERMQEVLMGPEFDVMRDGSELAEEEKQVYLELSKVRIREVLLQEISKSVGYDLAGAYLDAFYERHPELL